VIVARERGPKTMASTPDGSSSGLIHVPFVSDGVRLPLAVVAGVFVFARPQYRPAVQPRTYEMAAR
jgi:hypothetical protein